MMIQNALSPWNSDEVVSKMYLNLFDKESRTATTKERTSQWKYNANY